MPTRPTVLFVCVSNRGKSVMAEAISRSNAAEVFEAESAGTAAEIGGSVNETSTRVLSEIGVNIGDHEPRQLTNELMVTADLIVAVGTAAVIRPPAGVVVEVWDTDEPSARGIGGVERMRSIRDEIVGRVDDLAQRLRR
ncbi:low molecular weight phosphatase family protein [Gordonia sp. CPCC 205333]|uniref:arsenate-mycothiol transferase ArsC n=1 Tax=Gordonia sp. CPCC 205333 TaxID=3140790 RepID=UPI003AF38F77